MNASNNYRTGALMENLEGRQFFSATGAEGQAPIQTAEVAYTSMPEDHVAKFNRPTGIDNSPVKDGPVNDGGSAVG